jgi:predicted esterase
MHFRIGALGSGIFAVAVVAAALLACKKRGEPPPTETLTEEAKRVPPKPPLVLTRPAAPPTRLGERDLSTADPGSLAAGARRAAQKANYDEAAVLQYWAVNAAEPVGTLYDLACYVARSGKADAAFYWLQEAAAKDGVNASWAEEDADLESLRADARWQQITPFLRQYNYYWKHSGITEESWLLPSGYDGKQPLPLLIGLHGLGHNAKGFVDEDYRAYVDEAHVAMLGVSGTFPLGPKTFSWSEDPALDLERIDAALAKVGPRFQIAAGKVLLFGFSQGASMSVEIAARHPERFAGALALSPGLKTEVDAPTGALGGRSFVLLANEHEHPATLARTSYYDRTLRSLGARVYYRPFPKLGGHTLPPDYSEKLPDWVKFIFDPAFALPAP